MIAVSEAFVLAESLGLDHQALFDVVSTASGQCWSITTNCPVPGPVPTSPANRDFQGGFATKLMAKDLRLALRRHRRRRGRRAGPPRPLHLRGARVRGADLDFSVVIDRIRERSEHGRDRHRMSETSTERPARSSSSGSDRVAVITLNRPDALNALNLQVMQEVTGAVQELDRDPGIGCIVITGAGRAFAAGADIKEMQPRILPGDVRGGLVRRVGRARRRAHADGGRRRRLRPRAEAASWRCCATPSSPPTPPVRPARDEARRHARNRRLAAPHPPGRQGQGDGHVSDRPDDGRRGGRTGRSRLPGRAGRRPDDRSAARWPPPSPRCPSR